MNVYALDVDGTLECGYPQPLMGRITLSQLKALSDKGHIIAIVSDSPASLANDALKQEFYLGHYLYLPNSSEDRVKSLLQLQEKYPNASNYYYIDNWLGNIKIINSTKFQFILEEDFPKLFSS